MFDWRRCRNVQVSIQRNITSRDREKNHIMDDKWRLPHSIELNGELYDIRTDFRAILDILQAMSDPELTEQEKNVVMLQISVL